MLPEGHSGRCAECTAICLRAKSTPAAALALFCPEKGARYLPGRGYPADIGGGKRSIIRIPLRFEHLKGSLAGESGDTQAKKRDIQDRLSYFQADFPDTFRTALEIRDEIAERGWNKVVAFQTRDPMHRAHEELCRMAMERLDADGVVIHMLLGKLKLGDIPASVRDNCIRKMVDLYFPENSVMVTGYGFDMLYAGPREAVLHAVFRQNMGATHLIVGRDHAGVGDYYGAFDAQTIFDNKVPEGALEIEIFNADHTAFSKKLGRVVMMNEAEDHTKDDFILLSGTKVAALLFKQVQKDNDLSGLLFEKFDAHRKLMRYEQRAFNQLRKRSQVKK